MLQHRFYGVLKMGRSRGTQLNLCDILLLELTCSNESELLSILIIFWPIFVHALIHNQSKEDPRSSCISFKISFVTFIIIRNV